MNGRSGDTTNTASGSSTIGAQTGAVHGDFYNFVAPPDATPEWKFEIGVNCLDSGIASRARTYITDAVMEGYQTERTLFYWILALVSGRLHDELPDDDANALWDGCEKCRALNISGGWGEAVSTVCHILEAAERTEESETEIDVALKELDRLDPHKRGLIVRHTEDFVRGPIRDGIWKRDVEAARLGQHAGSRAYRVWKFFEPDPANPRVLPTDPPRVPKLTWAQAVAGTAALAGAVAYTAYALVAAGRLPLLFVSLLSLTGGGLGARAGLEWRFRVLRCRAKDAAYAVPRPAKTGGRTKGFAANVTERFKDGFAAYVPRGTDKAVWLARTEGVRRSLRDEIVEIYREQRTSADAVAWLIRHLVRKVRREWSHHTLYAYRTELATRTATKATAVLGGAALASGGLLSLAAALTADPLHAAYALFFLVLGGWAAVRTTADIVLDRRRADADGRERARELGERWDAHARWTKKLRGRPSDREMSAWLECDRKILLDEALRHHSLPMSDVLAYTFLEAPGSDRHGRARGGPWRYLTYNMLLFVLTKQGVRQLQVRLDMRHGTFHDRVWSNYRYDALAAVEVDHEDNERRAFKLALVSGHRFKIIVMPNTEDATDEASGVTLEAAGIRHSLRILEGIAADGKAWINHMFPRTRRPPTSKD
ncbi:MAG TPA: hypothetical protein VGL93_26025 [Streptosporangiaceae bacterium]